MPAARTTIPDKETGETLTADEFDQLPIAINDHADRLDVLADHVADDDRHAASIAGPFATWQAAQPPAADTSFPAYIRSLSPPPTADSASMTFT